MPTDNPASASTVPSELDHYSELAEHWWDKTGPFWPLHQLNAVRIQWIAEQLTRRGMSGSRSAVIAAKLC